MINLFGTMRTYEYVQRANPGLTLDHTSLRDFPGGWIAEATTSQGEKRIILWAGNDYLVFTREQAKTVASWLQEQAQ